MVKNQSISNKFVEVGNDAVMLWQKQTSYALATTISCHTELVEVRSAKLKMIGYPQAYKSLGFKKNAP